MPFRYLKLVPFEAGEKHSVPVLFRLPFLPFRQFERNTLLGRRMQEPPTYNISHFPVDKGHAQIHFYYVHSPERMRFLL